MDNSNEKKTFLQEVVEHDKCGTDAYSKNLDRIFNQNSKSVTHDNCGTPDCCKKCDTAVENED